MRKPRERTPSAAVEHAVLDAATRLLESSGPEALSIRRIAAEAGVAPMSVYNRFANKGAVVAELFGRGFEELAHQFAGLPPGDAVGQLREGARRYRAFALRHPSVYAVMFDRAIPEFEPDDATAARAAAAFGELRATVERGMAEGSLRAGDPAEVAQRLWAASHGAVSLELRAIGFVDDPGAFYERLVDTVLAGLRV